MKSKQILIILLIVIVLGVGGYVLYRVAKPKAEIPKGVQGHAINDADRMAAKKLMDLFNNKLGPNIAANILEWGVTILQSDSVVSDMKSGGKATLTAAIMQAWAQGAYDWTKDKLSADEAYNVFYPLRKQISDSIVF